MYINKCPNKRAALLRPQQTCCLTRKKPLSIPYIRKHTYVLILYYICTQIYTCSNKCTASPGRPLINTLYNEIKQNNIQLTRVLNSIEQLQKHKFQYKKVRNQISQTKAVNLHINANTITKLRFLNADKRCLFHFYLNMHTIKMQQHVLTLKNPDQQPQRLHINLLIKYCFLQHQKRTSQKDINKENLQVYIDSQKVTINDYITQIVNNHLAVCSYTNQRAYYQFQKQQLKVTRDMTQFIIIVIIIIFMYTLRELCL
eukprot:TRINITY_DN5748_c0_g1_i11.p2 TRINITY_DN5748_c0_g1~~TRINITY_DN5748_c0_g1_i11.p2  ORF type:complete len:257 (+),score=-25.54 TRINITY_DN5748_c0_g1_i11:1096-1866(+)